MAFLRAESGVGRRRGSAPQDFQGRVASASFAPGVARRARRAPGLVRALHDPPFARRATRLVHEPLARQRRGVTPGRPPRARVCASAQGARDERGVLAMVLHHRGDEDAQGAVGPRRAQSQGHPASHRANGAESMVG